MLKEAKTFDRYAGYYDVLYAGKDYSAEVDYIHGHIQRHVPGAHTLLDLGCGTGRHVEGFARKGYHVVGVDRSEGMLALAKDRLNDIDLSEDALVKGDVRHVRLGRRFDVVVSLFHVMSYQVENEDLLQAFSTAHEHLVDGGLFVFDCWYGPGVLSDPPAVREKLLENDHIQVTRKSTPQMYSERHVVDVHFDVEILDKSTGETDRFDELHSMRYLFRHDIEQALRTTGFKPVIAEEWLTGDSLSDKAWNGFFGGRLA